MSVRRIFHRSITPALFAGLVFGAIVFAIHGSPASHARQSAAVSAGDDLFEPQTIEVTTGATVVWAVTGTNGHTVTSDTGLFDSGVAPFLRQDDTFSFTFDRPGTYGYYCQFHGGPGGVAMAGTIIVREAQAPAVITPSPTSAPAESPAAALASPTRSPATPDAEPAQGSSTPQPGGDDGGLGQGVWIALGVIVAAIAVVGGVAWRSRRRR